MSTEDPRQRLAYDRTHLANERTFAAWIRTGLAVAALGIAVAHFVSQAGRDPALSLPFGLLFILVGAGMISFGAWRFARVSRDLALAGSPSAPVPPWVIYVLSLLLAALLVVVLFLL